MSSGSNRELPNAEGAGPASSSPANKIAAVLILIVGFIWFVAFVDRVVLPLVTRSGAEIQMPDLRMIPWQRADSLCRSMEIDLVRTRTRPDDKLPSGVIVDQYPTAGSLIKPGRRAEVIITDQEGLAVCPDVVGRSPREASIIADSSGLTLNSLATVYRHSESDPEGVVIGQTPPAFTGVLKGAELKLVVSLGSKPSIQVVPDLFGLNFNDVEAILKRQGLEIGVVARYPDRNRVPGTIIGQVPAAGVPAEEAGVVDVRVAVEPIENPYDGLDSSGGSEDSLRAGR